MKRQYTVKTIIMRLAFVLSLLITGIVAQAQLQTGGSATAGKEFHVACLYSYYTTSPPEPVSEIQMKVVVEKKCHITAKYNYYSSTYWNGWDNTEVDPGIYTLPMIYDAMINENARTTTDVGLKTSKSLSITSTEDITVYVINYKNASTDAATILPTKTWGTEYHVVTMDGSVLTQYAVVAKEAGTIVTLSNGNPVTLNKGEVCHFGYGIFGQSITGKKVSANKPVAMFSGAASGMYSEYYSCASATFGAQTTTDHCYEQLWSTDKWGKEFFVWNTITPQTYNWGGVMAIVAKESGTNVTVSGAINGGNQLTYASMTAGSYQYVCHQMTGLCKVVSNKPIMVFTVLPDPALTYIPPVDQRILRAVLSPFKMSSEIVSNINAHSVEMLIPSAYWNQTVIKENGVQVNNNTYTATISPYFNDWMTVRKSLPNADIKIEVSCPGGLLAYMYGYGSAETYGYLAGAGAYNLQNYFTIQDKTTGADTYYGNTNETTHTFSSGDNIVVKRTVERSFSSITWLINDAPSGVADNSSMLNTLTFPASSLYGGENTLTMVVRYVGATADSLYVGKVWLRSNMSFGDAPASYKTAAHALTELLHLGTLWEMSKVQLFPVYSINANTAQNDNALTLATAGGYTDLNQTGFALNGANISSTFNVTNKKAAMANLRGWIDFNQNGVFDSDEMSANTLVPTSDNAPRTLSWSNAVSKLRSGKTYLRLRLSTNAISQPADTLSDGEVEDYLLNLNLIEVHKTVTPTTAKVGDTLSYLITVKNNAPVPLTPAAIIDPIPLNTTYVANSASPNSNVSIGNQYVGGQLLNSLKWSPVSAISAGATSTYTFKVKISAAPQLGGGSDSLISNVAYAILNSDSIPSTGATCNLADVEVVSFAAENDTVTTLFKTPVTIAVIDNDEYAGCNAGNISVSLSTHPAYKPQAGGSATVINNEIVYTPPPSFYGIDSLRYILNGCSANPRKDSATVYIAVLQPGALLYFACQGASISLSMNSITGVTYYWYATETGETPPPTTGLTKTVVKNSATTETFWVEARYGTIKFPRYKVELRLSTNCGTPPTSGCAIDGTVIWKEDFGGNALGDDRIKTTGIPANTNYNFETTESGLFAAGSYALLKYNENNNSGNWHNQFSDHTYPGDKNRGYMFMTNADASPNRIMYKNKIKGLCGGKISVSLWAANLNNKPETQTPTFRIELTDSVNMVVAAYVTTSFADFSSPSWKSYGFEVDIPASYDSLNLFIYPNTTGSDAGNDFVFDDVEIRICLPKVNISQPAGSDTIVCAGSSITFNGSYNDGSGTSTPVAKWLYSKTGNINNPDEWADVGSTQTGSGGVVNNNLTISPTTVDTAGYYRLVAADAANINKANCRSMSRVIHLTVTKGYIPPDIRVYVKPDAGTVHLSSYIDSLPYPYTIAWQPSADFSANQRGSLNVSSWSEPHTGVYKYTISSTIGCGIFTAKAYVHAISNYDKTETVYICKELPLSRQINLNRIFGVESSGGVWSYISDGANATYNNVTTFATGRHAGAKVFDAYKAFIDAGVHSDYNTGTPANHKKFEIRYTNSSNVSKTVRLMVY